MKKYLMSGLLLLLFPLLSTAQTTDESAIKETIKAFVLAADNSDADELATYLDPNFRIVMNRLFGSSELSVVSRASYLEKIRSKEWGGDTRSVKFHMLTMNGNTASVKLSTNGAKMSFVSLITLAKNAKDKWLLVSDHPSVPASK